MTEWKALGELTQGKLVYTPTGYVPPVHAPLQNPTINQIKVENKTQTQELASINIRALAKIIDLLLWLPAAAIPSFFLNADQVNELSSIQQKMQSADTSTQAMQLQHELFALIPVEAWQTMFAYIIIMLAIQAFFLAKSGQSIGKKLIRIKIVDAENGEKVNLTRIFLLRSIVFIILNMLFMPFITIADYLFALGKNRQTLHDKLAKTIVIKQ